jgi:phosphate transport system permease protein
MSDAALKSSKFQDDLDRRQRSARIWQTILLACTLLGILVLTMMIIDIIIDGAEYVTPNLFTNNHSRFPEKAGMNSGIFGSIYNVLLTALFCFPLGIAAAIYLEEYAPKNKLTDFINININNLAGVPSIVYGMLGLTVFGRMFGLFAPDSALAQFFKLPIEAGSVGGLKLSLFGIDALTIHLPFGRSLLAGGLTMSLLILPTVIISAREAIRSVPTSIREAAYGLGATRWQMIRTQVLPVSFPGILTGIILAMGRALGETAPLIIMGAFMYVPFLPENVWDKFTTMPIQIYNWITLPQPEYNVHLAAAGIIVLLAVLLGMSGLAIYLRNKLQVKW